MNNDTPNNQKELKPMDTPDNQLYSFTATRYGKEWMQHRFGSIWDEFNSNELMYEFFKRGMHVHGYENGLLTGDGTSSDNINLMSDKPYPVIGRYRMLDSHGLPARHIERFLFRSEEL